MIVCVFGRTWAAFVAGIVADLQRAAGALGVELAAVEVETALERPLRWLAAERVYVLPFDVPVTGVDEPLSAAAQVQALFPRAEVLNSPAVHAMCLDRAALAQRLLARGVPMPATMLTHLPDQARAFIMEHEIAVLKAPQSCGGQGDFVVVAEDDGTLAAEAMGRRYVLELDPAGERLRSALGVLTVPPPYVLQRLVVGGGRRGVVTPAQVLRAYIVDGQVRFWSERYREKINRPADFIITAGLGARYRLLRTVSEEAQKLALRAAEVLGVRVGAVDLVRTGSEGPYVLGVDTDGPRLVIDRQFKQLPEFRAPFDLDRFLVEALIAPPPEPAVRRTSA